MKVHRLADGSYVGMYLFNADKRFWRVCRFESGDPFAKEYKKEFKLKREAKAYIAELIAKTNREFEPMKHDIRINGEIKKLDCELGSGIFDRRGNEIFEGDKVTYISRDGDGERQSEGVMEIYDLEFIIRDKNGAELFPFALENLEVVGHVEEVDK